MSWPGIIIKHSSDIWDGQRIFPDIVGEKSLNFIFDIEWKLCWGNWKNKPDKQTLGVECLKICLWSITYHIIYIYRFILMSYDETTLCVMFMDLYVLVRCGSVISWTLARCHFGWQIHQSCCTLWSKIETLVLAALQLRTIWLTSSARHSVCLLHVFSQRLHALCLHFLTKTLVSVA